MKSCLKAIVGGLIAALSYVVPVSGNGVSFQELLAAALAFLVGFNAVFWTRNR